MTISSCVSLFDDWDLLKPALWSIDDLVEEIVVVDGAYDWMVPSLGDTRRDPRRSADEVYDVLAAFGAKVRVINGLWPNETAKRRAGYEACRSRHVMRNDADEVVFWDDAAFERFLSSGRAIGEMELPIYVGPGQISRFGPGARIERQAFLFDRTRISAEQHLGYLWLVLPPDERQTVAPADPAMIFPDPIAFTAHLTHWRTPRTALNRARFYVMNYVRSSGSLPWLPGFAYREGSGFDEMFRRVSPAAFEDILLGHPIVAGPPDMAGKCLSPSGRPAQADRVFAMLFDVMLAGLAGLNDRLCVQPRSIANGVPYVIDASTDRSLARLRAGEAVDLAFSAPVESAGIELASLAADATITSESLAVERSAEGIRFRVPTLAPGAGRPLRRSLILTVRFAPGVQFATFRASPAIGGAPALSER